MISATFLEFFALALALTGLAAVISEIALKDRTLFGEIARDVRAMAEPTRLPAPRRIVLEVFSIGQSANSNDLRKAA
jgi:hypothetical protein